MLYSQRKLSQIFELRIEGCNGEVGQETCNDKYQDTSCKGGTSYLDEEGLVLETHQFERSLVLSFEGLLGEKKRLMLSQI